MASADDAHKLREYTRLRGARRASVSAEVLPTQGILRPRKLSEKLDKDAQRMGKLSEEDAEKLRAAVGGDLLFKGLEKEQLDMLVSSCAVKRYREGDTIIRQDEGGHLFYIVRTGKLSVHIRDPDSLVQERTVLTYKPGDCFGELALMYNQPRAASVRADEASTLWTLERETFQTVIRSTNMEKSKNYTDCLASIPLFENLDAEETSKLVDVMEAYTFDKGHAIIKQGDPGETLFVLVEGTAVAVREPAPGEAPMEPVTFGAGDFFGEMALMTDQPRAASVTATSQCTVSTLDKETFMRLLGPCQDIVQRQIDHIQSLSSSTTPEPGSPPPARDVGGERLRVESPKRTFRRGSLPGDEGFTVRGAQG